MQYDNTAFFNYHKNGIIKANKKEGMTQNIFLSLIKFTAIDLIGELLYFPIWWYSVGAKKFALFFLQQAVSAQRRLGVGVWASNLFKPMYAQADWQGKLISFIIRIFQIIIRIIALVIWLVLLLIAFIIWLLAPLLIIYQIYRVLINLA